MLEYSNTYYKNITAKPYSQYEYKIYAWMMLQMHLLSIWQISAFFAYSIVHNIIYHCRHFQVTNQDISQFHIDHWLLLLKSHHENSFQG